MFRNRPKLVFKDAKKLDLSSNNEACYEISSKIPSKNHLWSSKNPSCRDQLKDSISDLIETHEDSDGSAFESDGSAFDSSDESSGWKTHPQTGSNFSKIPTNSEIPEIIKNVASVSSKTQKDTKPIKN